MGLFEIISGFILRRLTRTQAASTGPAGSAVRAG
jgi:hypothetical protein